MTQHPDPRVNAPPRASDLRGDDLRAVLLGRHEAYRRAHMQAYLQPVQRSWLSRLMRRVQAAGEVL